MFGVPLFLRKYQFTDNDQFAKFVEWWSDLEYEFDITGNLSKEASKMRPVMKNIISIWILWSYSI